MSRLAHISKSHVGRDILIIVVSISAAVFLAQYDIVADFMSVVAYAPLAAFVTGFFFTSLLTIAPAGVAFAEMAQSVPPLQLALWGAAGAVVGDLILFLFVRDFISQDFMSLMRGSWIRKLKALFKNPFLSWAIPVAGALVIASPLPDEVGLVMLGLSKADVRVLIPISYTMNFLGIFLIGLAVSSS